MSAYKKIISTEKCNITSNINEYKSLFCRLNILATPTNNYNIQLEEGKEQSFVIGRWNVPFVVFTVTTRIR